MLPSRHSTPGLRLCLAHTTSLTSRPQGSWFPRIRTRGRGEPHERRTGRLTEHCCISDVCLGSLRASRRRSSVGDMATHLLFSRSGLGQALERRCRALRLRTPVQIARGGQQLPGYRFLRQRHPLSVREFCSSRAGNGAISQKAPSLNGSPRLPSEGGVLPFGYILMSVVRRF